ncbi:unnamed protein product [Nezara viridula]|uniref:MD-2-related lipid-recognition domain-containing protein n=1 Tax=Nezara viridula TaxID=85310 RepID=A0A9P0MGA0_NEZVI|nr:unnamed protein product [Nezara viridula]
MERRNAPVFLSAILTIFICSSEAQLGKVDIGLKEILRCEDSGTEDITFSTTRLTRVSRTTVNYFTNFTLKVPLDDNLSAVSDLQAWGNGGWRPGFFTLDTPHLCIGCKELNPIWFHEIIKNTGHDDCPIPPGSYQVTAYNISLAEFNIPMFNYGKYKMINQIYKDGVMVGCIGMVLEATPKRKKLSKKRP